MDTELLTQDMIDILMQLSAEIQKARKNEENAALDTTCLPKTLISNPEPQSFRKTKLPYVSFTFVSNHKKVKSISKDMLIKMLKSCHFPLD